MVQEIERGLTLAGTRIVDSIANFLPGALILFVLLVLSFVVALVTRYLLFRALTSLDFDRRAEPLGLSLGNWTGSRSGSQFIAAVGFWMVLVLGLLLGLTALDATLPAQFAASVLAYVPHLLAALLILVVGGIIARFLATAVLIGAVNMGLQSARLLSLAVKWLVLLVTTAMALDHIGIGRTILLLAFGILFGGVVLAVALAVGLGAKDVVGRALERQMREPKREDRLDHV